MQTTDINTYMHVKLPSTSVLECLSSWSLSYGKLTVSVINVHHEDL